MKQLTAVLLLSPLLGSADPGPATKYLIDEPASLMDIGPLRMRLDLTSGTLSTPWLSPTRTPATRIQAGPILGAGFFLAVDFWARPQFVLNRTFS